MITTPPVMLLIFLFKRTKREPAIDRSKSGDTASKSGRWDFKCPCGPFCHSLFRTRKKELERKQEEEIQQILLSAELPEFKSAWYLPYR